MSAAPLAPTADRAIVVCHMATSIDGRADGTFFKCKMAATTLIPDYFKIYDDHLVSTTGPGGKTIVIGRKTASGMGESLDVAALPTADLPTEVLRANYLDPYLSESGRSSSWVAVVDPHGRIAWPGQTCMGGPLPQMLGDRWLQVVVSDWVSDEYLAHCRRTGIPYIFAGKDKLEPVTFLTTLKKDCGEERVCLMGGPGMNGSFHRDGCIDELSIMMCPFISCDKKDQDLMEGESLPYADYTLKKHEATPGGCLFTWFVRD